MNPKELQPSSIFINEKSIVIPELARTTNDKFWVIPIGKYEEKLLSKMKNIAGIDKGSRDYLIGLIQYINHDIDEKVLENLYQSNKIPVKDIIKNFGEVLGPFYALQVLQKNVRDKMHNVVFPVRSNYELFDFFILNLSNNFSEFYITNSFQRISQIINNFILFLVVFEL